MNARSEKIGAAAARIQRPLRYILLEAGLIALGVVLALFAQEWQQQRAREELGREALASIREELLLNKQRLIDAGEYHQAKATLIEGYFAKLAEDPDAHPQAGEFERGFINPAQLLDVAWETALSTDALHSVPYDDLLDIAAVYEAQETYHIQAERSGELIYKDMYEIGPDGIVKKFRSLYMLLRAFLYREQSEQGLLSQYDEAVMQIDRVVGDQAEP